MTQDTDIFISRCLEYQAPQPQAEQTLYSGLSFDGFSQGLAPEPRPTSLSENPWLTAGILLLILSIVVSLKHFRHLFSSMGQNLFFSPSGASRTTDSRTWGETRATVIAALTLFLSQAILITAIMPGSDVPRPVLLAFIALLAAGFYLFLLFFCNLIGYVFASSDGRKAWLRAFFAAQLLAATLTLIPALAALYYPSSTYTMVCIGIAIYIFCRALFILKGFKIFFHNFTSLLYFILYLCALEIVPLLAIRRIVLSL